MFNANFILCHQAVARQMLNRKQTPVLSQANITKKEKKKPKCEDARQKYFQHAVRTVHSYRSDFTPSISRNV